MENENVLRNMKFYDVYWLETELKPSEKRAYDMECSKKCEELGQKFPSVMGLPLVCPKCNRHSLISDFTGHALKAECPKCSQSFKPTNKQLVESLYNYTGPQNNIRRMILSRYSNKALYIKQSI